MRTPGPWVVHRNWPMVVVPLSDAEKGIGGASDPDEETRRYAKQIHAGHATDYPEFSRSRVVKEEAEANARLIAAAPELLDGCESALKALEWAGYEDAAGGVLDRLKRVIAKADAGRIVSRNCK